MTDTDFQSNVIPLAAAEEHSGSGSVVRTFVSSDGYTHHFRHWNVPNARGIVVGVHGIQSHSEWYEYSSGAMAAAGYSVYFADRRGSGLNSALRGHADHGLRLINDVRQLIQMARDEHSQGTVPVTLMGISWGGKIAAATAAAFPDDVDHLILMYPGLVPKIRPSGFQRLQLRMARDFDVRHRSVAIPLTDPGLFTDSRHWKNFIRSDRLALHDVTSGFLNAGRDLDSLISSHAEQIVHPTLMMLAGQDEIIDNAGTRQKVATFGTRHLTQITWPLACHTLEFEDDRDTMIQALIQWLNNASSGS